MNVSLNGHKKKDPTSGMDDGDHVAARMRPRYEQLAKRAFVDANADHDLGVAFDLDNPYVQTVIDQLAKQVRNVADTTKQQIADMTGRAAAEGWSTDQLARQIRQLGVDMTRSRSLTIARTESASGYTGGSIAAYQASGVVSETEWLMGPDSCDICQELNGTRAALGEDYPGGISGPPAHPRCTCTILPIIDS